MDRKKILIKNISLGLVYKSINLLIVFTTIPLLLNYLDKELYGIWATIFSLINIIIFVDGGIGNGLKTKLAESLSLQNFHLAKTYISTAYVSILVISLVLFAVASLFIYLTDFQKLFNTALLTNSEFQIILTITFFLVIIGFILNLYKSFYYANQQASKVELSLLIYQIIILISITLLMQFYSKSLLLIAIIYGGSNVLIGLWFSFQFFKRNKQIIPEISFFNKEKVKSLMGLSLEFFVIQLSMIVIFTTDNLIITNLIGPKDVATYDVVYRLFHLLITLSAIAQDPLWALYTDAYQKKDFNWIKKSIKRLNKLYLLFILVVIILYFIANPFIQFWTQKDLGILDSLLLIMAIFVLIRVYGLIYMVFLNAIGKIKLQMWLFVFGAIINIPISIFLVKNTDLGSGAVILGTVLSIFSLSILLPIQTNRILSKK
ncbi:oligosaccharide flippase family protein [Polaribacter sp. BAL334]|uniref:oligosaccharide flippase family protein n=1 Tax=Polaribacter sp. BAL334 TaxID=1708178 RepID=UPI0018D244F4|nr:oligosaccharide flippase family protein [Polaribacter sp. BAL334]MBG7611504.1 oligosaccharide flippase family protein [Polaribacter sp. BAL334]